MQGSSSKEFLFADCKWAPPTHKTSPSILNLLKNLCLCTLPKENEMFLECKINTLLELFYDDAGFWFSRCIKTWCNSSLIWISSCFYNWFPMFAKIFSCSWTFQWSETRWCSAAPRERGGDCWRTTGKGILLPFSRSVCCFPVLKYCSCFLLFHASKTSIDF